MYRGVVHPAYAESTYTTCRLYRSSLKPSRFQPASRWRDGSPLAYSAHSAASIEPVCYATGAPRGLLFGLANQDTVPTLGAFFPCVLCETDPFCASEWIGRFYSLGCHCRIPTAPARCDDLSTQKPIRIERSGAKLPNAKPRPVSTRGGLRAAATLARFSSPTVSRVRYDVQHSAQHDVQPQVASLILLTLRLQPHALSHYRRRRLHRKPPR